MVTSAKTERLSIFYTGKVRKREKLRVGAIDGEREMKGGSDRGRAKKLFVCDWSDFLTG